MSAELIWASHLRVDAEYKSIMWPFDRKKVYLEWFLNVWVLCPKFLFSDSGQTVSTPYPHRIIMMTPFLCGAVCDCNASFKNVDLLHHLDTLQKPDLFTVQ